MIGKTLQEVRMGKNLTLKDVSEGIMSVGNLSKIENDGKGSVTSVEKFFEVLENLNLSIEEFCKLTESHIFRQRLNLSNSIRNTLRLQDYQQVEEIVSDLENRYQKNRKSYYKHQICVLKASKIFHETKDIVKSAKEVEEIKKYLGSVDEWFYYELELFNNSFHFFDIQSALNLGEMARKSLEKRYEFFKQNELLRIILVNLSIKCLENGLYLKAYNYSSEVIGMTQSEKHLYENSYAIVTNQIACYKLKNGQFDRDYLYKLIDFYKFMKMEDLHQTFKGFVESFGIN